MEHYIAFFFGGVFFANAIPHFVTGAMGQPFQSPFAKPPGKGLSSSRVNVLWGAFNFILYYVLIFHIGNFDAKAFDDIGMFGAGAFLMAWQTAYMFGKFHGGNNPPQDARTIFTRPEGEKLS